MKVAILTLPLHTNIGGILQAYALQTALEKLGYSVSMLGKKKSIWFCAKNIIKKILSFKIMNTTDEIDSKIFIRNKFNSWIYLGIDLDQKLHTFDTVVVGSDQVWRRFGNDWNIYQYFLDFIQDPHVKKYAYAASFGKEEWMFSGYDTERIKRLIGKFTKVSVRENDAVSLCKKFLGVDAEWLLDPTMLLEKKDYKKLVPCKTNNDCGLVCYYIGKNEKNDIFLKRCLDITSTFFKKKWTMAKKQDDKANNSSKPLPTIENWLYNMMNASFVITNSFHGVAFSINFEKPFIVLSHESGGNSRIKSILSMFGLENRLVSNVNDIPKIVNEKIDWNDVSKIKESKRKQSIDFLKSIG